MQQLRSKRRRDPELWHKANRFVFVLIVFGLAAVALTAFYPQWVRYKGLASQLDEEQATLRALELQRDQRQREVRLLETDPEYVETIARDRLGVMREGEQIYRLDSPSSVAEGASPVRAVPAKP